MFPLQRFRGTPAQTLAVFAAVGALAVPALAIVQIASDGMDATLSRAAWWIRFGLAEAVFALVLVAAWIHPRGRAG